MIAREPGVYTGEVFLADNGGFVAAAPGKKSVRVMPEKSTDPLAIVFDALWCLTIVGIAAPISDALLGSFESVDESVNVRLEADASKSDAAPVQSTAGAPLPVGVDPLGPP